MKSPMAWAIFSLCLVAMATGVIGKSTHTKDTSVCTDFTAPPNVPFKPKPNITNQYHTKVQCIISNKNETTDIKEYFDAVNNRGRLTQIQENTELDGWYDYDTNEFITYFPSINDCSVTNLGNTPERFIFGYEKINGHPHIFSAAGALHFGGKGVNEVYMGVTTVRGITVDWWRSCQYWGNMDATMIVDWYFAYIDPTTANTWSPAIGTPGIPVRAHVTGKAYNASGLPHDFDHTYEFFDFRPYQLGDVPLDTFETPAGVQCPGRVNTHKFPPVANDAFSFTTEILDATRSRISFMKETFDYADKLVKFEYRTSYLDNSPYGVSDFVEIHDFHSGVAYITDINRGNCSVRAIEGGDFDVRSASGQDVRIRNSKEFFYFDSQHVTYEGLKQNRGVQCDSWVGTRTDYPFNNPGNSSWEWYFMADTWSAIDSGPEIGAIPIQMRIKMPDRFWDYSYNLYNFKKNKPDLLGFDVSACYEFRKRRKFQFMLPGSAIPAVSNNIELFKSYVMLSILGNTGLNPIRVAKLQTFFADSIIVTFELLDISPIIGDVQRAPDYKETPLNVAANTLAQMIQDGQFVIKLDDSTFGNIKSLVAMPNSIIETTYVNVTTSQQQSTTTGYGAGPMAGVGISMPILGVLLGIVFAYFFFK